MRGYMTTAILTFQKGRGPHRTVMIEATAIHADNADVAPVPQWDASFQVPQYMSSSGNAAVFSGKWTLMHQSSQSCTGNRLSKTLFPDHAIAQIIAPATASSMKWFAVAIMATRIMNG